jgi:hypothetical protein
MTARPQTNSARRGAGSHAGAEGGATVLDAVAHRLVLTAAVAADERRHLGGVDARVAPRIAFRRTRVLRRLEVGAAAVDAAVEDRLERLRAARPAGAARLGAEVV